jgi:hypothetical protein
MRMLTRFSGYQYSSGIKFATGGHGGSLISSIWKDYFTEEILVTTGKSSFSRLKGFRINCHETLASFFSNLAPSSLETDLVSSSNKSANFLDTVRVRLGKERSFEIDFMRTVRVPDDGKVYNLPPGLGRFPLFNIASFQDQLPREMVDKDGIFLPVYREFVKYHVCYHFPRDLAD